MGSSIANIVKEDIDGFDLCCMPSTSPDVPGSQSFQSSQDFMAAKFWKF